MRDCTCVGSCRGAAGLGVGWNCVVDNGSVEDARHGAPSARIERVDDHAEDLALHGNGYVTGENWQPEGKLESSDPSSPGVVPSPPPQKERPNLDVPNSGDALEFAARWLDHHASQMPIGHEDRTKGHSTFNWLKYAVRLLREETYGHTEQLRGAPNGRHHAGDLRAHQARATATGQSSLQPSMGDGLRTAADDSLHAVQQRDLRDTEVTGVVPSPPPQNVEENDVLTRRDEQADASDDPPQSDNQLNVHVDDVGDLVCEHGTAMDVHCCNCHSGFQFNAQDCHCHEGALPTDKIWQLLNEADDHKTEWKSGAWRQWFVGIVDAVSQLENDANRFAEKGQ